MQNNGETNDIISREKEIKGECVPSVIKTLKSFDKEAPFQEQRRLQTGSTLIFKKTSFEACLLI